MLFLGMLSAFFLAVGKSVFADLLALRTVVEQQLVSQAVLEAVLPLSAAKAGTNAMSVSKLTIDISVRNMGVSP